MFIRFFMFFIFSTCLFSLPKGIDVKFGDVSKNLNKNDMTISIGDRAIINWDSFSIGEIEKVSFNMQGSNSVVLNRVVGKSISDLLGKLESNGNIFLINPNGIFIGHNAVIDTNSFIGSTFDVLDKDFLEGENILFSGKSNESIINHGIVKAKDSDVILISRKIGNYGHLEAKNGKVELAAGREILLKPKDKNRVFIKPGFEDKENIGIENTGSIKASNVSLKADGYLYSLAIKDAGVIDAFSIVEEGGKILIQADNARVETSSKLTAKNRSGGGKIHIFGNEIGILDGAYLDANGGNGEVLIGGGFQGKNKNIQNARACFLSEGSKIVVDGIDQKDGGRVIIWSDEFTSFFGDISTQAVDGDGGFIEVSSKKDLIFSGVVNTKSINGKMGNLLLDPEDITISTAADTYPFYNPYGPPPSTGSNIKVTTLQTALASSSVMISTDQGNITILDNISEVAGSLTLVSRVGSIIFQNATYIIASGGSIYTCTLAAPTIKILATTANAGILANGANKIVLQKVVIGGVADEVVLSSSGAFYSLIKVESGDVTLVTHSLEILSSGSSFASIQSTLGGNIDLNHKDVGGNESFLMNASTSTVGGEVFVRTDTGGDISAYFSEINIQGSDTAAKNSGIFTGYSSGDGDIELFAYDDGLSITSEFNNTGDNGVFAGYASGTNSSININSLTKGITILAKNGTAAISSAPAAPNSGSVTINAGTDIELQGLVGDAYIEAPGGKLTIQNVKDLSLIANSSGEAYISSRLDIEIESVDNLIFAPNNGDCYIQTESGGNIFINSKSSPGSGALLMNVLKSPNSASILTNGGGDIDIYFAGSSKVYGGSSAGAHSIISTGTITGNGHITIESGFLDVVADGGDAFINTSSFTASSIDITTNGLHLKGGATGRGRIYTLVSGSDIAIDSGYLYLESGASDADITAVGNISIVDSSIISLESLGIGDTFIRASGNIVMEAVDNLTIAPTFGSAFIETTLSGSNININTSSVKGSGSLLMNESKSPNSCFIATDNGGNINVYFSGDSKIFAGTIALSPAYISTGVLSGNGNILVETGALEIEGANSLGSFAGIFTGQAGGSGNIDFSTEDLSITSGSSGSSGIIAGTGGGNIVGSSDSISIMSNGTANAEIKAPAGSLTLEKVGILNMSASGSGPCLISSFNALELSEVDGIIMDPSNADTYITTTANTNALLDIQGTTNPTGEILFNQSLSNYSSYIATEQTADISITYDGNLTFNGGTDGTSISGVFTGFISGGRSIGINVKDITVNGGGGSSISLAGIYTGYQAGSFLGGGIIGIIANDITLTGGFGSAGADKHNAEISTGFGGGDLQIVSCNDIYVNGGTGAFCCGFIKTNGVGDVLIDRANSVSITSSTTNSNAVAAILVGNAASVVNIKTINDLNITSHLSKSYIERAYSLDIGDDLHITAGDERAYIATSNISGAVIDVKDDIFITGGSSSEAYIIPISASDININVGEDFILTGGSGIVGNAVVDGYDNLNIVVAEDLKLQGNVGGCELTANTSVNVNAGRVELYGGNSGGYSRIYSLAGNIDLEVIDGSLEMIAGSAVGADAYIENGGNTSIFVQANLKMRGNNNAKAYIEADRFINFLVLDDLDMSSTLFGNVYIKALNATPTMGDLIIQAGEGIYLTKSYIENQVDDILLLAGDNMYIIDNSLIETKSNGDVTLVVDNNYPTSPDTGDGHFKYQASNITTVGGNVRIFTLSRDFDYITGSINGVAYSKGPEFIDSNQEVWGVYYPNAFFGGPGFTIFYKATGSVSALGMGPLSFAASELFYFLNSMKSNFYISDFYQKYIREYKDYSISDFKNYLEEEENNKKIKKFVYLNIR